MRKLILGFALALLPGLALAGNPVENSYGVTGSTSGTVTIRTLTGTYNFNLPATAGSSGAPLLSGGGGSTAMTWGGRSGNTTTFGTTTGTFVGGNCVSVDASGNFQDAGAACGSGSGTITSVTAGTGLTGGGTSGSVTLNMATPVSVANGGTGLASGTSGGILAYTASGTLSSSGALTANAPVIGGGAGVVPSVGSRSGNTTTFGTTTGTLTSGHCVSFDASGNLVDAGAACGTGSGAGSVTSVALALPGMFTVSGSPVTTTGTLTGALATQTANTVLSGPTTGSAVAPTFRALVAADLPATAVTAATYGDGTHVGQFTVDAAGRLTAASSVTITGAAPTGSAGGALTGTYPNPTLATQAANTALANVSGSTAAPTAASLPSCTDTGGNHLNYTSGTGFSCGTSGGGGGTTPSRQTNTTAVGNAADTSEDNLQTLTLTGGTMSTGGYLRIIAAGRFTGSTDSKSAKLILGSSTLCTVLASTLTVTQWQIEATFVATGSTTGVTSTRCWSGAANSSLTNAQMGPAPNTNVGFTLSGDVTIKTSGRNSTASTASSIVSDILVVEYFP